MLTSVAYSFQEFVGSPLKNIIEALQLFHHSCMNENASKEQLQAWRNSIAILQQSLTSLILSDDELNKFYVVLEYELPRERGRRPDVLLLFNSSILVIEFKDSYRLDTAYIDQVEAYARDLKHYHEFSHNLKLHPVLLMASQKNLKKRKDEVSILSPDSFADYINYFLTDERKKPGILKPVEWIEGDYAPLPSLIQAARLMFQHEELPSIKRAASAGIPQTLIKLQQIAEQAKVSKEHHLALITGVPGAGKTLVGISFVYETFKEENLYKEAVLLSGNGPLVQVLQYALKSTVFVQDVHGFLKQYGGSKLKVPKESIFIYDEAQRAWDKNQVQSKRGHNKSEPEDFLIIGSKKEWSLIVGLIGEGQEIHIGEEAGITQWNDAIETSGISWNVTCPAKLENTFTNAARIELDDVLDLTETLRSHLASHVQIWVNSLLSGNIDEAKDALKKVKEQQFDVYITRDLEKAKDYVKVRYQGQEEKRYGLLASSKDRILSKYGIDNDFMATRKTKPGPWYIDDSASLHSCCQLREVMTEFGCQGLELDFPIVGWGDDFIWNENEWFSNRITKGAADSFQLRKNSYRVLLSRGRDGMVIYVPADAALDSTYEMLLLTGLSQL